MRRTQLEEEGWSIKKTAGHKKSGRLQQSPSTNDELAKAINILGKQSAVVAELLKQLLKIMLDISNGISQLPREVKTDIKVESPGRSKFTIRRDKNGLIKEVIRED